MFNKTIDVVIKTHSQDIINKKIIEKVGFPSEYKNIKTKSHCPFSKFSEKFLTPTIKSCDGLANLFQSSLMIKSWADFYFKSDDNNFNSSSPSNFSDVQFHLHDEIQVTPFKFYPKLMSPFFLSVKKDVKFLLHKAYYHDLTKRQYPVGVVSGSFSPNIIFELEKNSEDFIDYLSPMVYLTALSDKKIKLHYELIEEKDFLNLRMMYDKKRFSHHTVEVM